VSPFLLVLVATLVAQDDPGRRVAQAGQAEVALQRGDRAEARRLARAVTAAYERDGSRWPATDRIAAARAYVVLGADDAQALRRAVAAFDAAIAADSANLDARLRLGDLFLAKYNAPDARAAYESVLRLVPGHPAALLGIAQVLAFEGQPAALDTARRALTGNGALVGAHVLLAQSYLEAEAFDSARAAAARALAVDSSAVEAWAVLGAAAWLRGDSTGLATTDAAARRYVPRPAGLYAAIAEAAARHRRYTDAVRFARQAVALDSASARALGVLGTNELRTGDMESGRAHLERAFELDPFHVWNKNTLDLLDHLRTFRTTRSGRFQLVTPPRETDLLTLYLAPLLADAYEQLAARYGYRPPEPIRIELYDRHADFSVRTVGLAGLGALGVSFGSLLAMDAPSARDPGSFNWGSTAWHELTHAFTLGQSGHRVPRWLSEGMSVLEERRARPGWGADASLEFLMALARGRLRPVSNLNDGFLRPAYPGEVQVSYYQASLVCEMIERERGVAALVTLLVAFRDGLDYPAAIRRALDLTPDALDRQFDRWLRARFPNARAHAEFGQALEAGRAWLGRGRPDSARAAFTRAQQVFPEYAGEDGPAWHLAQLDRAAGDLRGAAAQLARITGRNETALEANRLEADVLEQLDDARGAMAALERLLWIAPYEESAHSRLAALAAVQGDHARAVRERRAVVALRPSDPLEARYQLARALWQAGDRGAARREILAVLEQAPGFEKAQLLLLELRSQP
jgi:tetratricopeptide (TPR) repeat protein